MSIPEDIRSLAREGYGTADIARRLGIDYRRCYNVLKASDMLPASRLRHATAADSSPRSVALPKPQLLVEELIRSGFELSGRWILSDSGEIAIDRTLPSSTGVYAFAKGEFVVYVGVATMGLAKRMYFYIKPGVTQRTNHRLNGILKNELLTVPFIEIYSASPPDLEWNGLPIHGSVGLEFGLIKKFTLLWNIRSAN